MDGLLKLVKDNIRELSEGIAYFAVGKRHTGRGYRSWDMLVIYPETTDKREFGDIRRLIRDDEKTILFNPYESAWVGFSEEGDYKSVNDIAKRIRNGYLTGLCRADFNDVDRLMPETLFNEMKEEYKDLKGVSYEI